MSANPDWQESCKTASRPDQEMDMRKAALLIIAMWIVTTRPAWAVDSDPNGGHQSQQGTRRHGTLAPFDGVDIPYASARRREQPVALRFQDGRLVASDSLVGVELRVLAKQGKYVLQIREVYKHTNLYTDARDIDIDIDEYDVLWRPVIGGGAPQRLCPDGQRALAVPGTWRNGQLAEDGTVFTFACVPTVPDKQYCLNHACGGGVIAKCIDTGYAPWVAGAPWLKVQQNDHYAQLPPSDESARQLHN